MQRAWGFAEQGGHVVWTAGIHSHTLVQESAPFARIWVYHTGTTTLAMVFSDNQSLPTPMGNPFTADENGYWFFYAHAGRYDVTIEAEHWTWTIGDILLQEVYNWELDVQANGHCLLGLGCLQFGSSPNSMTLTADGSGGIKLSNDNGCVMYLRFNSECDLQFSNANGVPVFTIEQEGGIKLSNANCAMSLVFDANCNLQFLNNGGVPVFSVSQNPDDGITLSSCIHYVNDAGKMSVCLDPNNASLLFSNASTQLMNLTQQGALNITGNAVGPNTTLLTVNGDITSTYSLDCNGQVTGAAFGINGLEATGGPVPGYFVINGDGQFIGHGVNVGQYGMAAAYLQLDGQNLPPNTTVLSIFGAGGSVADVQVHGSIEIDGQMLASVYGITNVGFSVPGPTTFTTVDGKTVTIQQGLVMGITSGAGGNFNVANGCYQINGVNFACPDGSGGIALGNISAINGSPYPPSGGGGGSTWTGDQNASGNSLTGLRCLVHQSIGGQMSWCIDAGGNMILSNANNVLVNINQDGTVNITGNAAAPNSTLLNIAGDCVAQYSFECFGHVLGTTFGITGGGFGWPQTGAVQQTFQSGDGRTVTVQSGLIMSVT